MAAYEQIKAPNGQFCDDQHPIMRGYKMACCDCGLVHDIHFDAIKVTRKYKDGSYYCEVLDPNKYRVMFRVRRNNRSTAMVRRWKAMPKGTKVERMFTPLKKRKGKSR